MFVGTRTVIRRSTVLAAVMFVAGSLSACGQESSVSGGAPQPGDGGFQPGDVTPIVLQLGTGPVELAPWTYCLGNGCADGAPPENPHDVGDPREVAFTFARDGWDFTATFREHGKRCFRQITLPVEKTAPQAFLVRPAGLAGDWDVDVFGRGDGDVITTFRWHTPVDGAMPDPASGSVAVLADHDGELDSYGVELSLTNLAEQPRSVTASVTVTSAEGRTATIEPRRDGGCYSEGEVFLHASRTKGLAATRIGEGPFTYTVQLTLDGRTYVGTARWPADEVPDLAPHVPLTWEPALPSYEG
jgi:hypothetical protein